MEYFGEEWLKLDAEHVLKPFNGAPDGFSAGLRINAQSADFVSVSLNGKEYSFPVSDFFDVSDKKYLKRYAVLCFYDACVSYFNRELPWGSLTGVRPTKLGYEYLQNGGSEDGIADFLTLVYRVTPEKAKAVEQIIRVQRPYLNDAYGKADLYIHIPFCETRCTYCSFPSAVCRDPLLLDSYFETLLKEITLTKEIIRENGKELHSVYCGGGTPSVLSPSQIERLIKVIGFSGEFTFEAGREDSLTLDKLKALKDGGVTRVCVNPQTLNEETLKIIGRRQTNEGFYRAYADAEKLGFIINTDIIAGFENETAEDFKKTVDGILELSPANVTVHALCKKRGSALAETVISNPEIEKMMDCAWDAFSGIYRPYYLYRQKYGLGGFENAGFAKEGTECVNNITVMEEVLPVYACGAGAISKKITGDDIERFANIKDVTLYMQKFDEKFEMKRALFTEEK